MIQAWSERGVGVKRVRGSRANWGTREAPQSGDRKGRVFLAEEKAGVRDRCCLTLSGMGEQLSLVENGVSWRRGRR